jgi:hypothetical protein
MTPNLRLLTPEDVEMVLEASPDTVAAPAPRWQRNRVEMSQEHSLRRQPNDAATERNANTGRGKWQPRTR